MEHAQPPSEELIRCPDCGGSRRVLAGRGWRRWIAACPYCDGGFVTRTTIQERDTMEAQQRNRAIAISVGALFGAPLIAWGLTQLWSRLRSRPTNLDQLVERTGAPPAFVPFARVSRFIESRNNPHAARGLPELVPKPGQVPDWLSRSKALRESAAAAASYDRNIDNVSASPFKRELWVGGTYGLYNQIPTIALAPWFNTPELASGKVGPLDLFDPNGATVMWIDQLRRIQKTPHWQQLPPEERTFWALRRGLAGLDVLGDWQLATDRAQQSRANVENAIEVHKVDVPPNFMDQLVPDEWPDYPGARELWP